MVEPEKCNKTADTDRRRFLELVAKLGLAVPPVVTLTLTNPSYAASSGFRGGSSSGGSPGSDSSSGGRPVRENTLLQEKHGEWSGG